MANELNEISIIGRVGSTPESRYTPSGHMVTNFSVATTKRIKSDHCPDGWKPAYKKEGHYEVTTWYRVTAWRNLAEIVSKIVTKGKQVLVVGEPGGNPVNGKLQVRVYQTKDGEHAANREITASRVVLLGSRTNGDSSPQAEPEMAPPPGFVESDEIPF